MADFTQIIQKINDDINTNGVGAITGAKLNEVLRDMIAAINAEKQDPLTIDASPTEDSINPVQSGGVYEALEDKADKRTFEVLHIHQIPIDIASGLLVGDFVIDTSDGKRLYVVTYRNANDFLLVTSDGINLVWYSYENNQYSDNGFFDSSIVERDILELSDRLDGKQDTISDLDTIRSGAAAGATAYQKPNGGIPASDLASGVIPNSVVNITSQQDGTVVFTMANGDTITIDLNHQHPNYYSKVAETTQPSGGMLPDVTYKLGTLTGATTFTFAAAVSGNVNHYYFTFTSDSTAVVPTWPASITSWSGNCVDSTTHLPVIAASKTYEISVLDGNAIIKEW